MNDIDKLLKDLEIELTDWQQTVLNWFKLHLECGGTVMIHPPSRGRTGGYTCTCVDRTEELLSEALDVFRRYSKEGLNDRTQGTPTASD